MDGYKIELFIDSCELCDAKPEYVEIREKFWSGRIEICMYCKKHMKLIRRMER